MANTGKSTNLSPEGKQGYSAENVRQHFEKAQHSPGSWCRTGSVARRSPSRHLLDMKNKSSPPSTRLAKGAEIKGAKHVITLVRCSSSSSSNDDDTDWRIIGESGDDDGEGEEDLERVERGANGKISGDGGFRDMLELNVDQGTTTTSRLEALQADGSWSRSKLVKDSREIGAAVEEAKVKHLRKGLSGSCRTEGCSSSGLRSRIQDCGCCCRSCGRRCSCAADAPQSVVDPSTDGAELLRKRSSSKHLVVLEIGLKNPTSATKGPPSRYVPVSEPNLLCADENFYDTGNDDDNYAGIESPHLGETPRLNHRPSSAEPFSAAQKTDRTLFITSGLLPHSYVSRIEKVDHEHLEDQHKKDHHSTRQPSLDKDLSGPGLCSIDNSLKRKYLRNKAAAAAAVKDVRKKRFLPVVSGSSTGPDRVVENNWDETVFRGGPRGRGVWAGCGLLSQRAGSCEVLSYDCDPDTDHGWRSSSPETSGVVTTSNSSRCRTVGGLSYRSSIRIMVRPENQPLLHKESIVVRSNSAEGINNSPSSPTSASSSSMAANEAVIIRSAKKMSALSLVRRNNASPQSNGSEDSPQQFQVEKESPFR